MRHGNTAQNAARKYSTICGTEIQHNMRHGNTARYAARKYNTICGTEIQHNVRHGNTIQYASWKYSTICGTEKSKIFIMEIQHNIQHGNTAQFQIAGHSSTDWVEKFCCSRECRFSCINLLTLNLLAPTIVSARINPEATNVIYIYIYIYIWSTHS